MKAFIVVVLLVTVFSGVFAVGGMMSASAASVGQALCPVALISGLLFFVLAARQSRKDKEAREDRRWQAMNTRQ